METPVRLSLREDCLVAELPASWHITSWAPHNGGDRMTRGLFNRGLPKDARCKVYNNEEQYARTKARLGMGEDAVGFLTAAEVKDFQSVILTKGPFWVQAVATVGLTNARAIGDTADREDNTVMAQPREEMAAMPLGTINLWVFSNALHKLFTRLEALHLASAAKTAALLEAGVKSSKSGRPAIATGTDTLAIVGSGELRRIYCGMHTPLGEILPKAVYQAVLAAIPR